jgi:hypothetical protein
MDSLYFLKLRSNISIDGDVDLAQAEIKHFFDIIEPIRTDLLPNCHLKIPHSALERNLRRKGTIGFVCSGLKMSLSELVNQVSFIQEIWFEIDEESYNLSKMPWLRILHSSQGTFACAIPMMTSAEYLSYIKDYDISKDDLAQIFDALVKGGDYEPTIDKAINRRLTSTPHVHGLHKFKAKFFPRMIRSFLNQSLRTLPKNKEGRLVLLDPFVGSGTSLIEAAVMDIDSKGIDIDVLSCEISKAKIHLLSVEKDDLEQGIGQMRSALGSIKKISHPRYSFPPWIKSKFDRWGTAEERGKYEDEITRWKVAISTVKNQEVRRIIQICLSDAISRKFNLRMMGTGSGRFALEIAKAELSDIVEKNLVYIIHTSSVFSILKQCYGINLASSDVINGTATRMPIKDNSISIILTSPPYLPASSGRENYLIGKSISITALGLMTSKEIEDVERNSVGSMKPNGISKQTGLPQEVIALYEWLKADINREVKAKPVLAYYEDLKGALGESFRVLATGGVAIYIIGKESVFYKFSTRKVLYRVKCDSIFRKIAEDCGFCVENKIDVELDKKNLNARPRSLDIYYESVFVLRKPKA